MTKTNETHPVDEFVNPNGIPDKWLGEAEARLWLLSQDDRRDGGEVRYDATTERWVVDSVPQRINTVPCAACGKSFKAVRTTAKYCSRACSMRTYRAGGNAKKPRPTWDINEPDLASSSPADTGGPSALSGTDEPRPVRPRRLDGT